jgi:M6 family metalloprotease-like protein
MRKFYLLLAFLLIVCQEVFSVIACPYPVEYKQPDGSIITINLRGDESLHWYETTDGYTLLKNSDGMLEYATLNSAKDLVLSGIVAKNIELRTSSEKAFLSSTQTYLTFNASQVSVMQQIKKIYESERKGAFPTTGSRKLVCILIGFTDLAFTKTQADFNNLFNQVGYTTDGAVGSVKDFYLENSWDQFTLSVTVAGPYTAANNMAYYGGNDASGNDLRPRQLAAEAVNLADAAVNFADFDNDGNGTVDGVYVIYAGYGEEAGASANAIWAHAWNLITTLTKDGKTISKYSCSSELRSTTGTGITRIGVICHEFGHVLGSPDYYDTNYSTNGKYSGTGYWDLMASGSWNSSGACPAHHNAYTKYNYYSWFTPTLLSTAQNVTINNIEDNKSAYYFNTATSGEFYFMENRQQTGFDAAIPGHGMIIYHVDENGIDLSSYTINATHPQYMYPVCANALTNPNSLPSSYGMISSTGCPFPGSGGVTEFTDGSLPGSIDWDGNRSNKPITKIAENTGVISFTFMDATLPGNFIATAVSNTNIDLTWTLNSNSNPVLIAYSTTNRFGTPVNGTTYSVGDTITGGGTVVCYGTTTSKSHTSLAPATTYYYKAWSNVSSVYSSSVFQSATTNCGSIISFPYSESFRSTALPGCWTQVDNAGNNQIWQFGALTGYSPNPALTGYYAYLNSDAYGSGSTQNADLISPVFDFSKYTNIVFGFNHYFRFYAPSTATLSYSKNNGASWTVLQTWTTASANPAAFSQNLTTQVAGFSQVLFKWNYTGTWAYYWAIDDISVTADYIVQPTNTLTNISVTGTESVCYDATDTIYVAGNGTTVDFQSGSTVNLIAGQTINLLPGTHAYEGCYLYAYITTESAFCNTVIASVAEAPVAEKSTLISDETVQSVTPGANEKLVKVYPNPNNGRFTLELTNFEGTSTVSIINTLGSVIYQTSLLDSNPKELEMTFLRKGFYFVKIRNGETVITKKIIIQ